MYIRTSSWPYGNGCFYSRIASGSILALHHESPHSFLDCTPHPGPSPVSSSPSRQEFHPGLQRAGRMANLTGKVDTFYACYRNFPNINM